MIYKSFSLLILLILCVPTYALEKGIYGEDQRREFYELPENLQQVMRASAAQIRRDHFSYEEGMLRLNYKTTVKEEYSLCSDVAYAEQFNPAECSGFLIAPDLLLTAGHCVRDESECKSYRWVFDFYYQYPMQDLSILNPSSVHACAEIVDQEYQSGKRLDYALIRLSPPVLDRKPLALRRSGEIELGAQVLAMGHPLGIPGKMAAQGQVQKNGSQYYFTTNLDTFVVNSGSAVLNAQTLEVEGILVRGGRDLKFDGESQCNRFFISDDSVGEEEVMRITRLPL